MTGRLQPAVLIGILLCWLLLQSGITQSAGKLASQSGQPTAITTVQRGSSPNDSHAESSQAEDELQKGTALTRKGNFSEAIPHLLAARGKVSNEYAASFNLGLCYVGTGQYKQAIQLLNDLRREGHNLADVENLLAQAYIGNGQSADAFTAFENAAAITPQSEKLYLLVADACKEHEDFALGLKVVDLGLQNLPQSMRLHYQRGMLLSQLDQFDRAKAEFELASKQGQGSDIGYIAAAQEELLSGDITNVVKIARDGISKGFDNPILLTILGQALIRSGVAPGEPEFNEAQTVLEKAVSKRPNDASAQISLGQIYLSAGRLDDAINRLERAREMQPNQPSVYAILAKAYQRRGDSDRAQQALAVLEKMNEAQAEKIRSTPGERKMSYGGGDTDVQQLPHQ
jgi:predicted Zn-dependent protease